MLNESTPMKGQPPRELMKESYSSYTRRLANMQAWSEGVEHGGACQIGRQIVVKLLGFLWLKSH